MIHLKPNYPKRISDEERKDSDIVEANAVNIIEKKPPKEA
jgi:hypothetical protein